MALQSNAIEIVEHMFSDAEEEVCAAQVASTSVTNFLSVLPTGSGYRGRLPVSKNVNRGPCTWHQDYLAVSPVYPPHHFREVFRIPLSLYWKLKPELLDEEPTLKQQFNAYGKAGHSPFQKILGTLRRLGSGCSFKQLDYNVRMGVESQRQAFMTTLRAIYNRFGPRYLNKPPSLTELSSIVEGYKHRGFPGCIGAIDCMHLHWKNCPKAYKGRYHNPKDGKLATISCEGLCDSNLYCWHWFAGRCGTNNDITVVDNSPLFIDILNGTRRMTLPEGYEVNGVQRQWLLYMLADGIYPEWAVFVKPNHAPTNDRQKNMTEQQEAGRKDIKRFFGTLQGRFQILRTELHEWSDEVIILISQVCVIQHNMIVDMDTRGELRNEVDEEGAELDIVGEFYGDISTGNGEEFIESSEPSPESAGLVHLSERNDAVTDRTAHFKLADEL